MNMIRVLDKFYSHINGLRAVAVISVFFFHLAPEKLPGGYLGVDVFFVISGFVITQSLYKRYLKNGHINVIDFYIRRFQRLYPALVVMVIATTVLYVFVGFLWDSNLFLKSSITSIFGVSNLYYLYHGSTYFEQGLINPLLHTWSLGVEEQFYVFYPLLFIVAIKLFKNFKSQIKAFGFFLFSIAVLSFFSYFTQSENIFGDFYWPLARFWELLAGCSLFFICTQLKLGRYLQYSDVLGFFILLFLFLPQSFMEKDYIVMLLTVGSTMMIILYGLEKKSLITNILDVDVLQYIGTRSYSIYLWHLPVIYFCSLYLGTFSGYVLSIVITISLGHVSYRFIEMPFRNSKKISFILLKSFKYLLMLVVFSILTILMVGVSDFSRSVNQAFDQSSDYFLSLNYLEKKADISNRVEADYFLGGESVQAFCSVKNALHIDNYLDKNCFKSIESENLIYLTGDSHATHFISMLDSSKLNLDIFFQSSTKKDLINLNVGSILQSSSTQIISSQLETLSKEYQNIYLIISYYLTPYEENILSIEDKLAEYIQLYQGNTSIIFIAPTPVFKNGPASCVAVGKNCILNTEKDLIRIKETYEMLLRLSSKYDDVYLFDPYADICPEKYCSIYNEKDDVILYMDDDHISVEASKTLAATFDRWFTKTFID
ncbi:MAG: acyltransferase [Candidatus Pacebacteria bacterium]|nr:acyltransferase [Candidatus Paceibacterota bacterium]